MQKKYPISTLNQLGSYDAEDDGVLATSLGNYSIKLNHDKGIGGIFDLRASRTHKEGEKIIRQAVGDTKQGGSVKALTIHEYGHLVSRAAMNTKSDAWIEWKEIYAKNQKTIEEKVSQYAGDSPYDGFAECFTLKEYEKGNLDEIVPGLSKALDKVVEVHTISEKQRKKKK